MKRIDYNMREHGFVGHLSVPERETGRGVLEKSEREIVDWILC